MHLFNMHPNVLNIALNRESMLVYLYCTAILERWKSISYLSNKKSIRKVDGFPTTIGSFCVDPHTAATMHPAPAHL